MTISLPQLRSLFGSLWVVCIFLLPSKWPDPLEYRRASYILRSVIVVQDILKGLGSLLILPGRKAMNYDACNHLTQLTHPTHLTNSRAQPEGGG